MTKVGTAPGTVTDSYIALAITVLAFTLPVSAALLSFLSALAAFPPHGAYMHAHTSSRQIGRVDMIATYMTGHTDTQRSNESRQPDMGN